jgi:hypothetical protein
MLIPSLARNSDDVLPQTLPLEVVPAVQFARLVMKDVAKCAERASAHRQRIAKTLPKYLVGNRLREFPGIVNRRANIVLVRNGKKTPRRGLFHHINRGLHLLLDILGEGFAGENDAAARLRIKNVSMHIVPQLECFFELVHVDAQSSSHGVSEGRGERHRQIVVGE